MPIFEQTYRNWDGTLKTTGIKWLPIFRAGVKERFRKRLFILFYISAFIPFLVFAIMLAASALKPEGVEIQSEFFNIGPTFFARFLNIQAMFVFILTLFVGSPLINQDYNTNALQLYLSKPLTPVDYIFGKASIVFFFILSVTAAPAIVLFLMRVLMMNESGWIFANAWILGSIVGYSLALTFFYTFLILLFSAITKNGRFAAITFFITYSISTAVAGILYEITRKNFFLYLGMEFNLDEISYLFFGPAGIMGRHSVHSGPRSMAFLSLGLLAFITIICFLYLRKKVSKIEVIQ